MYKYTSIKVEESSQSLQTQLKALAVLISKSYDGPVVISIFFLERIHNHLAGLGLGHPYPKLRFMVGGKSEKQSIFVEIIS